MNIIIFIIIWEMIGYLDVEVRQHSFSRKEKSKIKRKIIRIGDSKGLTIPPAILSFYRILVGTEVVLEPPDENDPKGTIFRVRIAMEGEE